MAISVTQCISTILRVIFKALPMHTKRMVFWSCLYGKMCGSDNCTKEEALSMGKRLNSVMDIALDPKACVFPIAIGKYINNELENCANTVTNVMRGIRARITGDGLGGMLVNGPDSQVNVRSNDTDRFIKSIPSWMWYASPEFMLGDLQRLLSSHRINPA